MVNNDIHSNEIPEKVGILKLHSKLNSNENLPRSHINHRQCHMGSHFGSFQFICYTWRRLTFGSQSFINMARRLQKLFKD